MAEVVAESAAEVQASLRKVNTLSARHLLLFWLGLTNVLSFILFAWDKFKSGGSGGNRIGPMVFGVRGHLTVSCGT